MGEGYRAALGTAILGHKGGAAPRRDSAAISSVPVDSLQGACVGSMQLREHLRL